MENYEALREEVKSRTGDALSKCKAIFDDLEKSLGDKIEEAKSDQVLSELKKLGARLDRLEAKLPDPEPEVE